jgi:ligand-binding SRPBCC domain-containing protein
MALCSFVWNNIRFFTRKDILVTLGIAYQVVNQHSKLTINDFKKKETLSKSCIEMEEKLIGIHAYFYTYIKENTIVNSYFEFEKDPHTGE